MQASDVTAVGGSTRDVAQVAPAVYTTLLDLGPLAWVVIGMEARSGHIWPPNAAAKRVTFEYTPTVSFTFSEELLPGDTTGLTNLTVTATFATGVTGVAKSDFIVTGATTHEFAALTKRHYALNISVFNATEYEPNIITVNLEGRSGNIFPPNYPAPMASLLYCTSPQRAVLRSSGCRSSLLVSPLQCFRQQQDDVSTQSCLSVVTLYPASDF